MINHYLTKGINLININQLSVTINKTQFTSIIHDILQSDDNAALLRAITPALQDAFPQFPDYSNVSITGMNEDGSAQVSLKQPRQTTEAEPEAPLAANPIEDDSIPEDD